MESRPYKPLVVPAVFHQVKARLHGKKRFALIVIWLTTAALIFAGGALEYAGSKFMNDSLALTGASAVGTVAFTVLAFRYFWKADFKVVVPVAIGLVSLPFVVGELLSLNGKDLNIHGAALLGMYFIALLSIIAAVFLLVSSMIRAVLRLRKDSLNT